jgi:hypothetical protein
MDNTMYLGSVKRPAVQNRRRHGYLLTVDEITGASLVFCPLDRQRETGGQIALITLNLCSV